MGIFPQKFSVVDLQIEYKIANTSSFHYLQLRHEVAAQFSLKVVGLSPSSMEKLLFEEDHLK